MNLEPINETHLEFIKKEDVYRPYESLDEDVTQLIEWLSKQPHLPNVTDRKWLTHFIIGCKFSLQRSKQVIESYFVARAELPEFFGSITREQLNRTTKCGMVCLFPKLMPEGHRVFCCFTRAFTDDDLFDVMMLCRGTLVLLDLQLIQEAPYGHLLLFDLKHFSLFQLLAFTPTITKNVFKCVLDCFPIRIKAIHFLNPPSFMGRFLTFFKIFMPNKIKERLFIHETLESLYQYIPKDVLPDAYGGTGGNLEKIEYDTIEHVMANKEWMESRLKADLSKLPVKSKTNELEMNGTFKKLLID